MNKGRIGCQKYLSKIRPLFGARGNLYGGVFVGAFKPTFATG